MTESDRIILVLIVPQPRLLQEVYGLKAATILHEALKFKSNNATPIKARIREALKLIDDI